MQFFTYMTAQYDNKSARDLQELINKLTTPGRGRLVYYGQICKANIVETLFGDEGKKQCLTFNVNSVSSFFVQPSLLFTTYVSCNPYTI